MLTHLCHPGAGKLISSFTKMLFWKTCWHQGTKTSTVQHQAVRTSSPSREHGSQGLFSTTKNSYVSLGLRGYTTTADVEILPNSVDFRTAGGSYGPFHKDKDCPGMPAKFFQLRDQLLALAQVMTSGLWLSTVSCYARHVEPAEGSLSSSATPILPTKTNRIYIYIYIWRERERENMCRSPLRHPFVMMPRILCSR